MTHVRPFARSDRDQLLELVNHHIAACLPGGSIPAAALLSQLEKDSTEYVTEPWVADRQTLVAVEHDRVVAAAHLKRYSDDPRVSPSYANAAAIGWCVFWPHHPEAGRALMQASIDHLRSWKPRVLYADGSLPAPGTYGIPDAWPHVSSALLEAGFRDADGGVEIILVGSIDDVPRPSGAPLPELTVRRVVGRLGVSFEAILGNEVSESSKRKTTTRGAAAS